MAAGEGPQGWTGVIPPEITAHAQAADEFQASVNKFAKQLWKETELRQVELSKLGAAAGFTPTMVKQANETVRGPFGSKPERSFLGVVLHISSLLVAALAGVSGNYLDEDWGKLVFPASVLATLVLGGLTYWKEGR